MIEEDLEGDSAEEEVEVVVEVGFEVDGEEEEGEEEGDITMGLWIREEGERSESLEWVHSMREMPKGGDTEIEYYVMLFFFLSLSMMMIVTCIT